MACCIVVGTTASPAENIATAAAIPTISNVEFFILVFFKYLGSVNLTTSDQQKFHKSDFFYLSASKSAIIHIKKRKHTSSIADVQLIIVLYSYML
jgi:hypothetical protein